MRLALVATLALTGCVNYHAAYMPQGERKPFNGPDPKDLPAFQAIGQRSTKLSVRLRAPDASAVKVKVDCEGSIPVKVFVNARALGESACPIALPISVGTIQSDTATLVELESAEPVLIHRVTLDR